MPNERVLISFGGPAHHYHERVNQTCNNASTLGFFTQVIPYTEQDLISDQEFWSKHGAFMTDPINHRGFGFWIWKSYIIHKTLLDLQDGDFLVYMDAGCEINPQGLDRMKEYQEMLEKNEFGLLTFQLYEGCEEIRYTKRLVLDYMGCTDTDKWSPQIMATAMVMKKTPRLIQYMETWMGAISLMEYNLLNDTRVPNEYPEFKDHRHDQSIHSQLIKRIMRDPTEYLKPIVVPDETWFEPNWDTVGIKYPIWARRHRHPV